MSAPAGTLESCALMFWPWSLNAYLRPVVADACLALQEEIGADVNILLWCAWTAASGRDGLDAGAIGSAMETLQPLTRAVTGPLRRARSTLRELMDVLTPEERRALRAKILDAELDAEQAAQRLLERLAPPAARPSGREREQVRRTARANFATYFAALGIDPARPEQAHKITTLVAAFFGP